MDKKPAPQPDQQKQYLIGQGLRDALVAFLMRQPYADVKNGIEGLLTAPEVRFNGPVTTKVEAPPKLNRAEKRKLGKNLRPLQS